MAVVLLVLQSQTSVRFTQPERGSQASVPTWLN